MFRNVFAPCLATVAGLTLLVFIGIAALSGPGVAHDPRIGQLAVKNPRAAAGLAGNAAAYFEITNDGHFPDRLVAIRTTAADRAELRTLATQDGVPKELPVKAIEIPAGGSAVLAPDGPHVALVGLKEPLRDQATVTITLVFEQTGSLRVPVPAETALAGPSSRP